MSRMKEGIQELVISRATIRVYIPGKGYVYGTVEKIDDDTVTVSPHEGNKVVMHYGQFSIERD